MSYSFDTASVELVFGFEDDYRICKGDRMGSAMYVLLRSTAMEACIASLLMMSAFVIPARAEEEFPFGMEMTLDAQPQPGSKRIPDLDIGDNGEVVLELWCKGGKGQFSVAGNTVVFVAGPMEDRACPAARAQADDELVAALTDTTTWRRQGDLVSFTGSKTLRFRLNTN
jgi:hypothetical protein